MLQKVQSAKSEAVEGAPGLYRITQPSGHVSYAIQYRVNGRQVKLTLAGADKLTEAKVKGLAKKRLAEVTLGRDPAAEKKQAKEAARRAANPDDMIATVFERYETLHLDKKRASTKRGLKNLFKARILPTWGKRRVSEITRRDVVALLDSIVADDAPGAANHVKAALSHFFGWCVEREIIPLSPAAGVKRPVKTKPRTRILSDTELVWAWRAADDIGWPFKQIVQLLILTGQRREEVAGVVDSELVKSKWMIPGERTKNHRPHTVYLQPIAVDLIAKAPRVNRKCGFVFSTNGKTAPSGFSRAKERLDEAMLKIAKAESAKVVIAPWVIHDLRRTFVSGLARLGVKLEVIERCVNHVSGSFGGIVGVYQQHDFADECAAAWKLWADHVETLIAVSKRNGH